MIYKINKNIQLSFDLKKKKIYEKNDFLVSKSNKEAYKLINRWPNWSSRKIIIFLVILEQVKLIYQKFGKKKLRQLL